MSFRQYTHCVPPKSHLKMNQYVQVALQALAAGVIGGLLLAAVGRPDCWPHAALITAIMGVLAYCHWWLGDRLVCLGGDVRAVGMLVSVSTPDEKQFFTSSFPFIDPDAFDTDYSINLLPFPAKEGVTKAQLDPKQPSEFLAIENQATKDVGLPFTGEQAANAANGVVSEVLHAEFEGGGVADLLLGTQIALGLAVVALIVCLGVPPPWGTIISWALFLLALLAMFIGGGVGLHDGGSPEDVGVKDLIINDNATGTSADILAVTGTWVYDAGHNNQDKGWNEIHPIKECQKLGSWNIKNNTWPLGLGEAIGDWGAKLDERDSPVVTDNQQGPEHEWVCHPGLDGCTPADGLIYGTIRWSDAELQLKGGADVFTISAFGPPPPTEPGGIDIDTPGPLLAGGAIAGSPQLGGGTWSISYAIPHAPLDTPLKVMVSTDSEAWVMKLPDAASVVAHQVAGDSPLTLGAGGWNVQGIDFALSTMSLVK